MGEFDDPSLGRGGDGRARNGKEGAIPSTERDRPEEHGCKARQTVGTVGDGLTGVPLATSVELLSATVDIVRHGTEQRPRLGS